MKHRPFALVLSGGGARGFAHVGALKALEENGLSPAFIVGVSMGGVVGVTYGMRQDWFEALMKLDFAAELSGERLNLYAHNLSSMMKFLISLPHSIWSFFFGWGFASIRQNQALKVLGQLTLKKDLQQARIPTVISTTDLISGKRILLNSGSAARAIYASAALAGVFPPLKFDKFLLVDGAYTDLAPVDVPRKQKIKTVIAIDASQPMQMPGIKNGFQALMRATDICHMQHAELRFQQADLLLRPRFKRSIDTLDFSAKNECVEAGYSMVKVNLSKIRRLVRSHT